MHFVGIDVPDELIHAALNGQLVILAGAGASMQPPVKLPNFNQLVEDIRKSVDPANREPPRKSLIRKVENPDGTASEEKLYTETPEQYLGRLSDAGKDIHGTCASLLGNQTETTELHRNILRLFGGQDYIRLITTNFDNCFDVALDELGLKPNIYKAPALPPGRNFKGIVYLHGTAEIGSYRVLTSADYGAAYLRDAWAARFLTGAFSNYHVLLVGYSCGDLVVDYLARALAESNHENMYALDNHHLREGHPPSQHTVLQQNLLQRGGEETQGNGRGEQDLCHSRSRIAQAKPKSRSFTEPAVRHELSSCITQIQRYCTGHTMRAMRLPQNDATFGGTVETASFQFDRIVVIN